MSEKHADRSLDDWQYYQCRMNGELASVFLDMGMKYVAPMPGMSKLTWLWIRMNSPREDGLSSDDEFDALCTFEDSLERALTAVGALKYVGRITTSGRREFYFYVPPHCQFEECVRKFLESNQQFDLQMGEKADPDWHQYLHTLYPGDRGLEQIMKP